MNTFKAFLNYSKYLKPYITLLPKVLPCLILLVFLSCSGKKSNENSLFSEKRFEYSDFDNIIKLNSVIYRWDSILSPNDILIKGNKLIVSSLTSSYGLYIIDKKTMKLKQAFGKIGFGPDEIPDVWQLDPRLDDNSIWVYSFGGKVHTPMKLTPCRRWKLTP
jgi:hypothetical protein